MQQDNEQGGVEHQHGSDAERPQSPPLKDEVGASGKSDADKKQDQQIKKIANRSKWAIVLSIIAPVIAFGSCAAGFLQWEATDLQNDIMAQQSAMMLAQLHVMRQQLSDARASSESEKTRSDQQLTALKQQVDAMTNSIGPATKSAAEAAKTSADTTARVAKASERSAATAEENLRTARIDLRAHVAVNGLAGFTTIDALSNGCCKIMVLNTGKTPAINMRTHAEITFVPTVEEVPEYDLSHVAGETVSVTVLGAGQPLELPLSAGRQLTKEEATSINNGTAHLFVRTLITYDDVFTPPHEGIGLRKTERCSVYVLAAKTFLDCDFGNYTD